MYARDNVADTRLRQEPNVRNEVIEAATIALAMLSDPTRLRLMVVLLAGESDVSTLTAAVDAARPAVSQHLAKLRLARLVTVRRDGRRSIYAINGDHVHRLVVEAVQSAEHHVSDRPAHHG